MAVPAHVLFAPEWVIEADGRGGFRVECDCGWQESGFDTSSLARAAGFTQSTGGRADAHAAAAGASPKRRWWRRD